MTKTTSTLLLEMRSGHAEDKIKGHVNSIVLVVAYYLPVCTEEGDAVVFLLVVPVLSVYSSRRGMILLASTSTGGAGGAYH